MKKSHDRAKIEALLEQREREGWTYREAAERAGIPLNTLNGWAYRLRKEQEQQDLNGFVEVSATIEEETPVQLVLKDDLHILVWRGFDSETLRAVVQTVS